MKVWGNHELAQGYVDDEHYRYHLLVLIKGTNIVALITRNLKCVY